MEYHTIPINLYKQLLKRMESLGASDKAIYDTTNILSQHPDAVIVQFSGANPKPENNIVIAQPGAKLALVLKLANL